MSGWGSDGDDDDSPQSRLALREAENGVLQARALARCIEEALSASTPFRLVPAVVCELNRLAVAGVSPTAGALRTRSDVEISGSRHAPPAHEEVGVLLLEACNYVNDHWAEDPLFLAAYVLWRICWIHPFDDGNGRCARAVSYLVLSVRLGVELTGTLPIPARIKNAPIAYWHALQSADAAWEEGRLDVRELQALLTFYLQAQLDETPPRLPP